MKKIISSVIFSLAFSFSVFAQAKAISINEYGAIEQEARSKTNNKIRRETNTSLIYQNEKVFRKRITTTEFLPPDKSKQTVIETEGSAMTKKAEWINTGDYEYRRENDDAWVKLDLKKSVGGTLAIQAGGSDIKQEFFVENITIDGEPYKILTKITLNEQSQNYNDFKMWINKDGLITKSTGIIKAKRTILFAEATTTYDFNIPAPKIEAPVKP